MQSKTKPWSRVLYGLGIRHVGSVNAQLLTQRFPTVELAEAEPTAIAAVYGIGSEIAQSVHQWFRIPAKKLDFTAQSSWGNLHLMWT